MLKFTKQSDVDSSIEIAYYDSSNIQKSYYNYSQNELSVVFSSGKIYKYSDVSHIEYDMFKISESQGKYLNSTIKTKPFVLTENIETADVIANEIKDFNNSYGDSLHELVKEKMNAYIAYNTYNEPMAQDIMNTIKTMIEAKNQ